MPFQFRRGLLPLLLLLLLVLLFPDAILLRAPLLPFRPFVFSLLPDDESRLVIVLKGFE